MTLTLVLLQGTDMPTLQHMLQNTVTTPPHLVNHPGALFALALPPTLSRFDGVQSYQ